ILKYVSQFHRLPQNTPTTTNTRFSKTLIFLHLPSHLHCRRYCVLSPGTGESYGSISALVRRVVSPVAFIVRRRLPESSSSD
ncbi:hypothetical protein PIB30_028748, partial [Stylosanthes scabra]|nr:hypothetical protein [Stylosanthes scabra]